MKKNDRIEVRVSSYNKNKIKLFAKMYADGNLSQWIVYACFNAPRKFLNKKGQQKAGPKNIST